MSHEPQPSSEPRESGPAAVVAAPPAPARTPPRVDQLPPYKVLLHNDDVNAMEYVAMTVMQLAAVNETRAVEITLEAHNSGVALVVVTHKERAELVQEQFTSKGLLATIEPAQ